MTIGVILLLCTVFLGKKVVALTEKLDTSLSNQKTYQSMIEDISKVNMQLTLDMNTLNNMNDSVSLKLKQAKEELKIKDRNIQYLQHLSITAGKKDTIKIRGDTVFVKDFSLDTLIVDPFREIRLKMEYPNHIELDTKFNIELNTIIHTKREYKNPRHKYWIVRIFQKRHTVIYADVYIENPNVDKKEHRFIKIIK